jgi:cytochrome c peroxidase
MKTLSTRHAAAVLALLGAFSAGVSAQTAAATPDLAPLPAPRFNAAMAELGRYLFFDPRVSGDAALACATCHDPQKGWTDGQPLGRAYPASEYFRNTPTILNATVKARYHWDGRLDGSDAGTLVRDQITESVFMNMDARLLQERVKQVPEYVELWKKFRNDDPNGMRIFNVIGEYLKTVVSRNVPFDRFKKGEAGAMSAQQVAGYELFRGKAGCVACHHGPVGSDGKLHRTGVPEHPGITAEPLRHITMLRHYSTSGMPNYMNTHVDVGLYAITKDARDKGRFLTPSLRDLKYTAPYMHNGIFATLEEVVSFYDRGGGAGSGLKPLALTAAEKEALVAFLREGLSGERVVAEKPALPAYRVRTFGQN